MDNIPPGFSVPEGRQKPWGTGQAVLSCKGTVKDPFVVINADDFYGASAFIKGKEGLDGLNPEKMEGFLVSYKISNTLSPYGYVTRGICSEENGLLTHVVERFKIGRNDKGVVEYLHEGKRYPMTGDENASMNFWGFTPVFFDGLEERFSGFLKEKGGELKSEYLLPEEVDNLIAKGRMNVKLLNTDASWFGVTYPDDKPIVKKAMEELVANGSYPSPLWE